MSDMAVRRHRIVIERAGSKSHRWHYAVEWECAGSWELRKEGYAWTLDGAKTKARGQIYPPLSAVRHEELHATGETYRHFTHQPSPLPSTLLGEH